MTRDALATPMVPVCIHHGLPIHDPIGPWLCDRCLAEGAPGPVRRWLDARLGHAIGWTLAIVAVTAMVCLIPFVGLDALWRRVGRRA